MINLKLLETNYDEFVKKLEGKNVKAGLLDELLQTFNELKQKRKALENFQAIQNAKSKELGVKARVGEDVSELKNELKIPVYINKFDAFMCESDIFGYMKNTFVPDVLAQGDESFVVGDFSFKFHHFPGHTPGCSMIEIEDAMFSGDFLFKGSIGRWDFPYSDKNEMLESLKKCKNLKGDFALYTGHGAISTLKDERASLDRWIQIVKNS